MRDSLTVCQAVPKFVAASSLWREIGVEPSLRLDIGAERRRCNNQIGATYVCTRLTTAMGGSSLMNVRGACRAEADG